MCFHPVSVPVYVIENGMKVRHYKLVNCGKCAQCLAESQKQWAFRIENEALFGGHHAVYFVTYTYAPAFLPPNNELQKTHVQDYMHDLRQKLDLRYGKSAIKVKYYFCGEYGSRYGRAHYHAILFFSKSVDWRIIQSAWGKGIVDILPFLPARAGYVAKYSMKQLGQMYDGKQPPFRLVSNGIGKCFIEGKTIKDFNYSGYYRNLSGYKIKLPRYYMDKLVSERNRWRSVTYFNGEKVVSNRSHTIPTAAGVVYSKKALLDYYKRDDIARAQFGPNAGSYDQWLIARQMQLENVYKFRLNQLNFKYNYE